MIKVFDTALKRKEIFEPIVDGKVGIYLCGPTVYDGPHLGHGRSAVAFDVIRRYFIYQGYEVFFVSNYTDIDDKMIKRAAEDGVEVDELANRIIPIYEDLYGKLGILPSDRSPKATEHIDEIIEIIEMLEKNDVTYVLSDGVYFDVSKFSAYGDFSGQNLDDLQMGARVEVNLKKKNPHDFVLWKLKKNGEPFWSSPWGDGRPGWHIECSAMTWKQLGTKFDIHAGGLDLVFPHHECEVAQSKVAFGMNSFAKYWLHNGFINIDNEKMSKSLGNFFALEDVLKKYDGKVLRLMFLQTHYRNPVNFSDVLLDQAQAALNRLHDCVRKLKGIENQGGGESLENLIERTKTSFDQSMNDDFDTSGALGAIFELVKEVNILLSRSLVDKAGADRLLKFFAELDKVLGVIVFDEENLDIDIEALILRREKARDEKDFETADEIRDDLLEKGILIEDTPSGTVWKKIS